MQDLYVKGDISPRISNYVFEEIRTTDKLNNQMDRVYAYLFLGVISYLHYNNKHQSYMIGMEDIKEYAGMHYKNRRVDYISKKKGVLAELGYIADMKNPYTNIGRNCRIKVPQALDETKKSHTFDIWLYFKCMDNDKLGSKGFYVANYINNIIDKEKMSLGLINHTCKQLGLNRKTVSNYMDELKKEELIDRQDTVDTKVLHPLNLHLRAKLYNWRYASKKAHKNVCYVSGTKENVIVHHLIPFSKLRDYVFDKLNMPYKLPEDYTEEEMDLIMDMLIEYHELLLGIPLNKTIHKEFHSIYGVNAQITDLLDFKIDYRNRSTI